MANATGFRATKTFSYLEESDFCEHCSAKDLSKAVGYFYEDDSCGPVGRYIVCAVCRDENKEAEGNQSTCCHDCKLTVLTKDTINWKWYDFYAPQGDELLVICKDCQSKEVHVKRVAKDQADYESEFGIEDADPHGNENDEDNDHWSFDQDDEFEEDDHDEQEQGA